MDIFSLFRFSKAKILGYYNYINLINKKTHNRKLFIDVTEVRNKDTGTGVQRVTNNVLSNIYKLVQNYEIIEVVGKRHGQGFYNVKTGKAIRVSNGDIFFGLDLSKFLIPSHRNFLDKMKKNGIKVYFFVHDLIPILYPELCPQKKDLKFEEWAETVVRYDGIIANSKATMDSVHEWTKTLPKSKFNPDLKYSYVHLGADFKKENTALENNVIDSVPTFLMVSTIEPKKKYDQVIKAFSKLWDEGIDIKLKIVGRLGWNSDITKSLIVDNPNYNKKLFWYNSGISDQELAEQYKSATAVIVASIVEGFGLALVEASNYQKPLIIRDLPVFREIVGDNAFYFSGFEPDDLAEKIKEWIEQYRNNTYPKSCKYTETWETCTKKICEILAIN